MSVKYLSPTSIMLWRKSKEEYYLRYLAANKMPRMPQTKPMSIGSSFDAYVKNYIVKNLFGTVPPEFEFDTIFESQVDEHNRVWARENGKHAFDSYKVSGALADLMGELELALDDPKLEFKMQKNVKHDTCLEGVPLLGYPDLYFVNNNGVVVVYDFKVNGYCSKSNLSPVKGYINVRDGWKDGKPSRANNQPHKDAQLMSVSGMMINVADYLNDLKEDWAIQLCIYSWLLDCPIGSDFIAGIEQLVCNDKGGEKPHIRVSSLRSKISSKFQNALMVEIVGIWTAIQSGHIFDDLSWEDNKVKCEQLDHMHEAFESDHPDQEWFNKITRGW